MKYKLLLFSVKEIGYGKVHICDDFSQTYHNQTMKKINRELQKSSK